MIKRKIYISQKFALLFVLNVINRVSNTFIFFLLIKVRTSNEASLFLLAVSYSLIVQALSFWSLDQLLIKDITEKSHNTKQIFPSYVSLRLTLTIIGVILFYIFISLFTSYPENVITIIVIMVSSLILEGYNDISLALFVAINDLYSILFINIILSIIKLILVTYIIFFVESIIYIFICIFSISFINVVFNIILINMKDIPISPVFNRYTLTSKIFSSLPLGIINLFWVIDAQGGNLFLSIMSEAYNISIYGVASTIITSLIIIPQTLQTILLPLIVEENAKGTNKFVDLYNKMTFYFITVSSIIILTLISLARQVIHFFDDEYINSLIPLYILSFTLFFYFLNIPNSRILIIRGKIWLLAYLLIISIIINWITLYLLFPIININAVALSRLFSISSFFLLSHFYIRINIVKFSIVKNIWQPMFAFFVSIFLIFELRNTLWFFRLTVVLIVFISVTIVLKILFRSAEHA